MHHPLIRTPAQRLHDAREDHARCLRLAAWYRRQLACGVPAMRERHAWAKRAEAKPASFVEQIDFPASTLAELLAIRDVAKCVGDVASALTWGGRCHRRRNAHGAFEYNAAGMLVLSISDALTAVEAEADREAKRRVPANADEQSTRLFMLAPGSVDNDDPAEIEALGREILAHAEALRARA